MATGTYANRAFFMLGTNAGVVDTGIDYPPPTTPSIFQLLMNARLTWARLHATAPRSTAPWTGARRDPACIP